MPIRQHLSDPAVFQPEAIGVMSQAFTEACVALNIYAGDTRGRQIIAERIIALARSGVLDATALRNRVLSEAKSAA